MIEKYHFKPNVMARGLADTKTRTIGILAADIRNPYYVALFVACEKADTFLALDGWGKGCAFLNGFHLGRFWEIGPQKRLYIPAPLLREGVNEIVIFETEGKVTDSVTLWDQPDIG